MLSISFKPFQKFIVHHTIERTRRRFEDSKVLTFKAENGRINALLQGSLRYEVLIEFNANKVITAKCSCPYSDEGACKHIVNTMVYADKHMDSEAFNNYVEEFIPSPLNRIDGRFIIENKSILDFDSWEIEEMSVMKERTFGQFNYMRVVNGTVLPNHFSGILSNNYSDAVQFQVIQKNGNSILDCSCQNTSDKLCFHLNYLLLEILKVKDFQLAFNVELRKELLTKKAIGLGLQEPLELDEIFTIKMEQGRIFVEPKFNLLNLNAASTKTLKDELLPAFKFPKIEKTADFNQFIVISENVYSDQLDFEWMEAPTTKTGNIKSPIQAVNVLNRMKKSVDPLHLPFFLSLLEQKLNDGKQSLNEQLSQMKQILSNPLELPFYFNGNDSYGTQKITPKSIEALTVQKVESTAAVHVKQQNDYFVLNCSVTIDNHIFESKRLKLIGSFFFWTDKTLNFIDNLAIIRIINFFAENKHELFIHKSQFPDFQEEFLHKLEQSIAVNYEFVKPAPAKIVKKEALDSITEYMIYLSDSDDYIVITPVVSYGETEVAALSQRSIYVENPAGGMYSVERNEAAERRFLKTIIAQHPHFQDQNETDFFYLHKQEFLESAWFLDAFENWRSHNYSILGFNQLKNNRLNANKMSVSTQVNSGIDWFEVKANVKFGNQEVSLKDIQKSVLNKSRYIQLGDGSLGIMPQEWINHFGQFFRSGSLKGDTIRLHHTNFQLIDELFEQEVQSEETQLKLENYRHKMAQFHSIQSTTVPKKLKATLRDYQKEGLNWLNFLDEFGFGGCLADDMGLGKTIQMIAYLLQQQEKGNTDANLVIVPTSLLFNWELELDKFAPHLKRLVIYGPDRQTKKVDFSKYDLVLTTYGTMLSDVEHLRKYVFNCIILDESQAIKNPDSKRYKAARLLEGRQRLVMTGTPIENNTFDLFAQLSFAVPGLFGSAKRFADEYSTPIDKFQETKRAIELQQKIHPFVLRRTKVQVAKELPEKTEMILHCEMGAEQQRVYDAYKKEFQLYLSKQDTDALNRNSLHVLQGLTKLRQICNSPALLSDEEYYGHESAKLNVLMEQIRSLKKEHKILVFSQFVGMLDLVKAALEKEEIAYSYLTGKTKNRQEQVDLFQEEEEVRVFLISLKAGGTGLNLTKAEYVFLIDPWWNPAVENQAIDRAYRIGQENKVVAVRLITPNTIEEKIIELQSRKKQLVQDLVHTDTKILKQLSKDELLEML